jgi:hypothetical protein
MKLSLKISFSALDTCARSSFMDANTEKTHFDFSEVGTDPWANLSATFMDTVTYTEN